MDIEKIKEFHMNVIFKYLPYFLMLPLVIFTVAYFFYESGLADGWKFAKEDSIQQKYESIKLGDKQTKVIVDDTTCCKYIVFNNKTLTPLYDKSGKVEGCGE